MAIIIAIMSRRPAAPLPAVAGVLSAVGQNVRLARQRRQLSAELVAERAGMTRPTLRAIERGDAAVSIGSLANVLHTLGLVDDLSTIARDDPFGRKLADAQLETQQRVRAPRRRRSGD